MAGRSEPENMPGSRPLAGSGWDIWRMRNVFMPNGEVFMMFVIGFEIAVGLLSLYRYRFVDTGVIASVGWVLVVLPFLTWPYLMTNLARAALQGVLLIRPYNSPIWQRVTMTASTNGRSG